MNVNDKLPRNTLKTIGQAENARQKVGHDRCHRLVFFRQALYTGEKNQTVTQRSCPFSMSDRNQVRYLCGEDVRVQPRALVQNVLDADLALVQHVCELRYTPWPVADCRHKPH